MTALSATHPFSIIASKHRDGSVLLSTANDRIFKLNGVGSLTWCVLEQRGAALGIGELVQELCAQFEVINGAGELQYDVSPEQLKVDTTRFIRSLVENDLLDVVSGPDGNECYRIKADVSGTTAATFAELSNARSESPTSVSPAPVSTTDHIRPRKTETLIAFFALLSFDVLLRARGFEALVRKVERWPIHAPAATDTETCRRICATVNRAQVYYPKKAMCLQHSAVVTCLLRRHGVPAQMILAAQEFPPKGHAWVEVNGTVVNDKPSVREIYRTLRRV